MFSDNAGVSSQAARLAPAPAPGPVPLGRFLIRFAGLGGVALIGATLLGSPGGERALTSAERLARVTAFIRAGPLKLPPVGPGARAQALQVMQLPATQRTTLEQRRTELVWLTLWDDRDADGDTVEVESEGFRQQVRLVNAPVQLAIPRPRGGAIQLHGVRDGGGGITVAALSGTDPVALPVMAVGQTVSVPVR